MTKAKQAERQEAIERLREWMKPGDTVYTILENVSRSGMSRTIRLLVPTVDQRACDCHTWPENEPHYIGAPRVDFIHPNHAAGIVTGYRQAKKGDGLIVGGCGMDMGFHLVNHISEALYGGKRCDCGAWHDDARPAERFTQEQYMQRDGGGRSSDGWSYRYDLACEKCKGSGNVIGTGYQCTGKGCPSNYHSNHRDRINCPGEHGDRCYRPNSYGRYKAPANWPTITPIATEPDLTYLAACITDAEGAPIKVCETCKGEGTIPNPDGPERFDLEHFDGYALRHKWM